MSALAATIAHDLRTAKVALPPAFADALEARRIAAEELGETGFVDVRTEAATVAPDDVVALVEKVALAEAMAGARQSATGQVVAALDRRVVHELGAVVGRWVGAVTKRFDKAADAFAQAAEKLPAAVEDKHLVAGGSAVLAAYEQAAAAAVTLGELNRTRTELGIRLDTPHPGSPYGGFLETVTRYFAVDPIEAERAYYSVAEAPRNRLRPWLTWIRTPGLSDLRWRTLDEQREQLAALAATTPEPREQRTVNIR